MKHMANVNINTPHPPNYAHVLNTSYQVCPGCLGRDGGIMKTLFLSCTYMKQDSKK